MDMLADVESIDPAILKFRYQALMAGERRPRMRDAAQSLGVSEGVLLAAHVGESVTRLQPAFEDILRAAEDVGRVMALTRNEYCVHERKGRYRNASFNQGIGLVLDTGIDLRLFMSGWTSAFALVESRDGVAARSLQFFDAHGEAIHKIHLLPDSDVMAFERLVARFAEPEQVCGLEVRARVEEAVVVPALPASFDAVQFCHDWDGLQDTHDFFPMLKRHKVERLAAFNAAGPARAQRLERLAHRQVFADAQAQGLPIMAFVGNRGCIQIHSGPVENLRQLGDWFNVMDAEFNLHLLESGIAETWLVRKPTADGMVTSVELFDALGRPLLMLFGVRKPGMAENAAWRAIAEAAADVEAA